MRTCIDIHIRHFEREFGRQLSLLEIDQVKLQEYVNKRAKAKGRRGMPLRPETIKKELATLTAIWNWALRAKHVNAPLEKYGLATRPKKCGDATVTCYRIARMKPLQLYSQSPRSSYSHNAVQLLKLPAFVVDVCLFEKGSSYQQAPQQEQVSKLLLWIY